MGLGLSRGLHFARLVPHIYTLTKRAREREREREFAVYSDVSPSRRFPAEKNKNVCAPAKAVHVARYAASDLESLPVNRAPPGEIAHGVQLTAIRLNTLLSYASLLRPFLFSEWKCSVTTSLQRYSPLYFLSQSRLLRDYIKKKKKERCNDF